MVVSPGQVNECHSASDFDYYLYVGQQSGKLVVVDFTAPWCPPCHFIAPYFGELAKEYTNDIFVKVDVDELQTVAKEYQIEAMPTIIFIRDGAVVYKIVGANPNELIHKVKELSPAPAVAVTVAVAAATY